MVDEMNSMFQEPSSFNKNSGGWEGYNVSTMFNMFSQATAFNQNISNWDVSGRFNMQGMFSAASSFNQNLQGWCVLLISSLPSGFADACLCLHLIICNGERVLLED